jgi:hypothetical protein
VLLRRASHEPILIFHNSVRRRQFFSFYIYMKEIKSINHLDVFVYLCIYMFRNRALRRKLSVLYKKEASQSRKSYASITRRVHTKFDNYSSPDITSTKNNTSTSLRNFLKKNHAWYLKVTIYVNTYLYT